MSRRYSWPDGHWDWYRHLAFKHGISVGDLMFVGGQVDKTSAGEPLHQGDLNAQIASVVGHIHTVLCEFGSGLVDVTRLTAFYAATDTVDEYELLREISRQLVDTVGAEAVVPGPVITCIPLPCLALPGMMVEIEAVAVRDRHDLRWRQSAVGTLQIRKLPEPFSECLRCGSHVWVGGLGGEPNDPAVEQSAVAMERLDRRLGALGSGLDSMVRLGCWHASGEWADVVQSAANARQAIFEGAGPTCTDLPTPCLPAGHKVRVDGWAMTSADGTPVCRRHATVPGYSGAAHQPAALICDGLVFVGAQLPVDEQGRVNEGDLNQQTRMVMESTRTVLAGFDLALDDMVKQTAFYLGSADPETIVTNQTLRSSYYREPAGASTGVPLPAFAHHEVMVTVETIASIIGVAGTR